MSVSNQIMAEIRELLLRDEIKAGEFLGTESTLAERFGVGRSPMRDALRSLEARGVIDIRAGLGGGVYVAEGNADLFAEVLAIQLKLLGVSLAELLDAIWAVEGTAVELAAQTATREELDNLVEVAEELSRLLDQPEEFIAKSMEFHTVLVDASHSRALIAQAKIFREILFRHYSDIVNEDITRVVSTSLRKLATHLAARSRTRARRQLNEHYALGRRYMLEFEAS